MAATVSVVRNLNARGVPDDVIVTIAETSVGSGDSVTIDPDDPDGTGDFTLPRKGRIYFQSSKLTAGTGTTVDPDLADDDTNTIIAASGTPAAQVIQAFRPRRYFLDAGESFVHNSNPDNAAADHTITSRYLIRERWEDDDSQR